MTRIIHGMLLYLTVILLSIFITSAGATQPSTIISASWCAAENQFLCYKSDRCFPSYVRCDGTEQCADGEDEENCALCTAETAESLNKFFCPSSGKCVHKTYRCDGMEDCEVITDSGQKSDDELGCDAQQCTEEEFACGNGHCIDKNWHCDGQVDCSNTKDEEDCAPTCAPKTYTCKTNVTEETPECISTHWRCDGEKDCPLGDDELNCLARECDSGRFLCSADNKCKPSSWRCDGDNDCASGEDEKGCENVTKAPINTHQCTNLEFKCETGHVACIIGVWQCDGEEDCTDGSDEKPALCNGVVHTCSATEFKCEADKTCIPSFLTCSGTDECTDGADEKLDRCATNVIKRCDLSEGLFACKGGSDKCIAVNQVCDGKQDCQSKEDEKAELCGDEAQSNMCGNKTARCGTDPLVQCENIHTSYQNRTIGFVCRCPNGYSHVNHKCVDNDECKNTENPVCDHMCINKVGGHRCECNAGYRLELDGRSCKVTLAVHPKLLFTNRHEIRSVHIHGEEKEYMPLIDSTAAVALDFDYKRGEVFYSDIDQRKLFKFIIPAIDSENQPTAIDLKIEGVQTPDGLAYDWIYRHLYWTDTSANTINMACVDDSTEKRQTIVLYENKIPSCTNHTAGTRTGDGDLCIDEPRAIAVHPRKGWVFWSDWGNQPHIALGALDGSHMEMIAYNTDSAHSYLMWPNGLTLDITSENERLYWIDARLHTIFACNIDRCVSDISVLAYDTKHIKHPYSITVFENKLYWSDWSHRHIASANKYTGGNITKVLTNIEQPMDLKVFHPTSQVQTTNHCENTRCGQMCVPKPWSRPDKSSDFSMVSAGKAQHTCLCMTGFTLADDGKTCEAMQKPPSEHTTQAHENREGSGTEASGLSVGVVAAIAASIILVIAIFVVTVVIIVRRQIRKNKSKSMNFDNPIYKRTTEDKLELPRHEYQPSQSDPSSGGPSCSTSEAVVIDFELSESCVDVHTPPGDGAIDVI